MFSDNEIIPQKKSLSIDEINLHLSFLTMKKTQRNTTNETEDGVIRDIIDVNFHSSLENIEFPNHFIKRTNSISIYPNNTVEFNVYPEKIDWHSYIDWGDSLEVRTKLCRCLLTCKSDNGGRVYEADEDFVFSADIRKIGFSYTSFFFGFYHKNLLKDFDEGILLPPKNENGEYIVSVGMSTKAAR